MSRLPQIGEGEGDEQEEGERDVDDTADARMAQVAAKDTACEDPRGLRHGQHRKGYSGFEAHIDEGLLRDEDKARKRGCDRRVGFGIEEVQDKTSLERWGSARILGMAEHRRSGDTSGQPEHVRHRESRGGTAHKWPGQNESDETGAGEQDDAEHARYETGH